MKRFICKVGISFSFLVVVLFLGDKLITYRLQRSDKRIFTVWRNILTDSTAYDLVIMGSSRAWRHYSPAILDSMLQINSYNLGMDGREIDSQMELYRIYRLTHPAPKVILQNLDIDLFTCSNGFEREQFLPWLQNDSIFKIVHETERFSWADRYIPFVRYSGFPKAILEGLHIRNTLEDTRLVKGYAGRDALWNGERIATMDSVDIEWNVSLVDEYVKFAHQCIDEGTEIIFVFSPLHQFVLRKMGIEKQMKLSAFFERVAISSGVHTMMNYSDFSLITADTAYFYNATHMNRKGAELFTKVLANDLLDNQVIMKLRPEQDSRLDAQDKYSCR